MLKSLDAGLAKVMSKMGISVVDSYRGAHLFDILGLHSSVVDRCFPGTPAPLSGIGFAELDRRLRLTWLPDGAEAAPAADLPDFGWVRFRKAERPSRTCGSHPTSRHCRPSWAALAACGQRPILQRVRDLQRECGLRRGPTFCAICWRFVRLVRSLRTRRSRSA
jgi:hypothetical protein